MLSRVKFHCQTVLIIVCSMSIGYTIAKHRDHVTYTYSYDQVVPMNTEATRERNRTTIEELQETLDYLEYYSDMPETRNRMD